MLFIPLLFLVHLPRKKRVQHSCHLKINTNEIFFLWAVRSFCNSAWFIDLFYPLCLSRFIGNLFKGEYILSLATLGTAAKRCVKDSFIFSLFLVLRGRTEENLPKCLRHQLKTDELGIQVEYLLLLLLWTSSLGSGKCLGNNSRQCTVHVCTASAINMKSLKEI